MQHEAESHPCGRWWSPTVGTIDVAVTLMPVWGVVYGIRTCTENCVLMTESAALSQPVNARPTARTTGDERLSVQVMFRPLGLLWRSHGAGQGTPKCAAAAALVLRAEPASKKHMVCNHSLLSTVHSDSVTPADYPPGTVKHTR